MTKELRKRVFQKFQGKCAYCGCGLGEKWHVDHLEPLVRNKDGSCENSQNHNDDNFMPSCVACNLSKKRMSISDWRLWIKGHIKSLNRDNPAYRTAKRYGLIVEHDKEVVFYFERFVPA